MDNVDLIANRTGVGLVNAPRTSVLHLRIVDNIASGVVTTSSTGLLISENTILGPGGRGVLVTTGSGPVLVDRNEIVGSAEDGPLRVSGGSGTIAFNTVSASGNDGIAIDDGSVTSNAVAYNDVTASADDGIAAANVDDTRLDVAFNTSSFNSRYGVDVTGNEHKRIVENVTEGNGYDGIRVNGLDVEITDNIANDNGFEDSHDAGDGFGYGINASGDGIAANNEAGGNDDADECDPMDACN